MKGDETKERLIDITSDIITRQGIRSARVDDIARLAGISKRTLYELFADKNALIYKCLEHLSAKHRETISDGIIDGDLDPLHKVFRVIREFVDSLYLLDRWFLSELKNKAEFTDNYDSDFQWWAQHCTDLLRACVDKGYIIPDTDIRFIAEIILVQTHELRVAGRDKQAQKALVYALLRGICTPKGIAEIDSHIGECR